MYIRAVFSSPFQRGSGCFHMEQERKELLIYATIQNHHKRKGFQQVKWSLLCGERFYQQYDLNSLVKNPLYFIHLDACMGVG